MGISLSNGISIESPKSSFRRVQVRALTASGSLKLRLRSEEKEVKTISKICYAIQALWQSDNTERPLEFPRSHRHRCIEYSAQWDMDRGVKTLTEYKRQYKLPPKALHFHT